MNVGDVVRVCEGASSMLAGKEGRIVAVNFGGTNRYVSREPHYKVAFGPPDPEDLSGLWFDHDEVEEP